MKYSVITFGCRVNQADSLVIEDVLRARGGTSVAPERADLVVVNSCSVTATADQGTRQAVRRVVRSNPGVKVVVTGCYATRRADEVEALPNVVRVVGNDQKDHLDALLHDVIGEDDTRFGTGDGPCGATLQPGVAGRTALTLRVQTGCDQSCSYCIIPRTRGAGRSRPLPQVKADIERAIAAGYKEIVLTGVHLGSYGRDLGDACSLADLVEMLAARAENVLFRISSLEPMDCSSRVIDAVRRSPRLAPHFHLPLQHGSDRMLQAMRRPYSAAGYAELVLGIRHAIPWASIGTDLIAGFPGERESDAEATERLIERLPLTHVHVFPYSDRPGTEASRLDDKVDGAVVRERSRRLRAIGHALAVRFRQSQAGSRRKALTVDDGRSAITDNYLKVPLDEPHARNEWIEVTIP